MLINFLVQTLLQVNLCQKLLFLHQLTHNMTTDCSLNYMFNSWKFLPQNMGRACSVRKLFLTFRTISVHNMICPCCTKRRVSDKDLPVSYSPDPELRILNILQIFGPIRFFMMKLVLHIGQKVCENSELQIRNWVVRFGENIL